MSAKKRPFRIWSSDRKIKKTVVVTSLDDLIDKSREKLGYREGCVQVVLEHDGTLVEDEDYFSFLDDHTALIVLQGSEKWKPVNQCQTGIDETDLSGSFEPKRRIEELAILLKQDLAKLVTMTVDDLQTVVDAESAELSQLLGSSLEDVEAIQTGCQRALDDRNQATEAKQLLQLLTEKLHSSHNNGTEQTDIKRQRIG